MNDISSLIDEATRKNYEIDPKTNRQKMFLNTSEMGKFPGYGNEQWCKCKYSDGTWHGKE